MKKHYCYIVQAGNFVKIGYTSNIENRLEQIQTNNPKEVKLLVCFPHETRGAARAMEQRWHLRFSVHLERGEWYRRAAVLKELNRNEMHEIARGEKHHWNSRRALKSPGKAEALSAKVCAGTN